MTRCPSCGHHNGGHSDDCEGPPQLTDVGHGPCPCPWCSLMRRNPDADPLEKLSALREDDPNIINVPASFETY